MDGRHMILGQGGIGQENPCSSPTLGVVALRWRRRDAIQVIIAPDSVGTDPGNLDSGLHWGVQ